jgi:hypothetical protein
MRVAAATMAVGMVGAFAPAASATEREVPCEAIFGEYLCKQFSETGQFIDETVNNLGPIVDEWRHRIAELGNETWATLMCYVSGDCPILVIEP